MQRFVGLLLLACACTWDGTRSDVIYSCPDQVCPEGQACRAGVCKPIGTEGACTGETRFADEFDDLDATRWDVMMSTGAVAHAVDGQLAIDYTANGADAEVSMIDRVAHDDATVTVEVVSPRDLSSGFIRMRLFDDFRDTAPLVFMADSTDLSAVIDSDLDVPKILRTDNYDPQRYRFWRISRTTDQACFYTSRDGVSFEEFACGSNAGVRSSLRAGLSAGNYAATDPQTVAFDHFTWCGP
ncbi:MAG: hypothetical protein HOV81_11840 [Kofleriaceae bacterium]|nr:hypothetical protein [Kofleriaceae bacterium]